MKEKLIARLSNSELEKILKGLHIQEKGMNKSKMQEALRPLGYKLLVNSLIYIH